MTAARRLAIAHDVTAEEIAQTAVVEAIRLLAERQVLTEPKPPEKPMDDREAAMLLCALSQAPRLDDPDTDHVQLLDRPEMVEYAWASAVRAGIDPSDTPRAHEARRLLRRRHGLR